MTGFDSSGLLAFSPTYSKWLEKHSDAVERYLFTCINEYSRMHVKREFEAFPQLGYAVVRDFLINNEDINTNINKLLDYIRKVEVFVILILGMPGSGKTTTAYKLCELLKDEYQILQVAPLITDGVLPDWIGWISHISKARAGDLVIVDEASIKDSARRSGSRQNMEDLGWLAVGRQIGCKIIYLTQISAMADINLTRWANIIISKGYNTSAVGASEIERKHIAENPIFQYLIPKARYAGIDSEEKDWAIVSMHNIVFMCCLKKPHFMNDKLSKPYQRFIESMMTPELEARLNSIADQAAREVEEERLIRDIAMKWAHIMKRDGQYASVIKTELEIRGFRKSLEYWKEFTGESKKQNADEYYD